MASRSPNSAMSGKAAKGKAPTNTPASTAISAPAAAPASTPKAKPATKADNESPAKAEDSKASNESPAKPKDTVINTIRPTIAGNANDSPFRKAMVVALGNLEAQISARNKAKKPLPGLSDKELENKIQDILALVKAHYHPSQSNNESLREEMEIIAKFGGFLKQWAV